MNASAFESSFEAYWGHPLPVEVEPWESPVHPDRLLSPVPPAVRPLTVSPPRSYRWRPDLTLKTDGQYSTVCADLLGLRDVPDWKQPPVGEFVQPEAGSVSEHVQCRAYRPSNWFTAEGVNKKRRQIELRGLPSFHCWRFITLTIDQAKFIARGEGPCEAYLAGKERMRRFMDEARKSGLWKSSHKWAWKLEFHRSGWPHWHLLVGRKSIFSVEEMSLITELWGLGGTSVEMVRNEGFIYTFKYAFKSVLMANDDEETHGPEFFEDATCVPDWFLDYLGFKMVKVKHPETGEIFESFKPVSFSKVRFWQTSKDFYTGQKPEITTVPKTQISWAVPQPVRVAHERAKCLVQVVARNAAGGYASSGTFEAVGEAYDVWKAGSRAHTYGDGAALGVHNYFLPVRDLKKQIKNNTLWKLLPLLLKNRLSLRHATLLQTHGKCWKTS